MDPDHIFRILNMISAHYDTYQFSDEDEKSNKFGFDKIIIVADLNNIENIFHHKYGPNTDFKGYINKFYSKTPFLYDNKLQIASFIQENYSNNSVPNRPNPENEKLVELLQLFHEHNLISLRDIIKINQSDFSNLSFRFDSRTLIESGPYTKAIVFLCKIFGSNKLINMIEKIKENIHFQKFDKLEDAKILLVSLGFRNREKTMTAFGNSIYTFTFEEHYSYRLISEVTSIKCYDSNDKEQELDLTFNTLEFYNLLIENIKRISVEIKN
jgi:hypothetical protein